MIVYLNGHYLPIEEARVSPNDRGFVFADGVYEVVRAIEGRIFLWDDHLERLRYGLKELRIREPDDSLKEIGLELLRRNGLDTGEAMVYLQITRGECPRSHRLPPAGTVPTVYGFAKPMPDTSDQCESGIGIITVEDLRWGRCDIKSIGLLANSLAYEAACEAGAKEAIFVRDGLLVEGARSNVFFVKQGTLLTPPEGRSMLSGITRKTVISLARELGIPVLVCPVAFSELPAMEEAFVCGTTSDITPVVRRNGEAVGSGLPGAVTRRLQSALRDRMMRQCLVAGS